jgi:hypothetical protein
LGDLFSLLQLRACDRRDGDARKRLQRRKMDCGAETGAGDADAKGPQQPAQSSTM